MEEYGAIKKMRQENRVKEANETAVQNPVALKASNRMLEGKLNEPVFERLSKKPDSKKNEALDVSEPSVTVPLISLHRGVPISVALYDLAKIQNQKKVNMREQQQKN